MATARIIIGDALSKIGVISAGEPVQADDAALCLRALNRMLGSWSTSRLSIPYETQLALTAASNPLVLADRPMSVVGGEVVDATLEYQVAALSNDDYFSIADKSRTGRPTHVWWDQKYPASSLLFYPVPDKAYPLTLRVWSRLVSVPNLDTDIVMPGEYEDALVYNLAVRIAPDFGRPVSTEVAVLARDCLDTIQKYHAGGVPTLTSDLVGSVRRNYSLGGWSFDTLGGQ